MLALALALALCIALPLPLAPRQERAAVPTRLVEGRLVARSGELRVELASLVLRPVAAPHRAVLVDHGGMCGVGVDAGFVEQDGALRFALELPVEDYVVLADARDAVVWPPRTLVRPWQIRARRCFRCC